MNPARKAETRPDQLARARMIARTLPVQSAVGYCQRAEIPRTDQLALALDLRDRRGTHAAATFLRALGWSIECALLTLIGARALERWLDRELMPC